MSRKKCGCFTSNVVTGLTLYVYGLQRMVTQPKLASGHSERIWYQFLGAFLLKKMCCSCATHLTVCVLCGLGCMSLICEGGKALIKHPYGRLLVVMARTKRKKTNDSCFHCCQRFFANLLPCKIKVPVYVISVPDLSAPVTFRTALSLHIYPRFSVGGALQPALFSTFAVFSFSLVTFSSYSFPSQASWAEQTQQAVDAEKRVSWVGRVRRRCTAEWM